jgi:hypothetical protein
MATSLDLALLAGAAYLSNRGDINRFPIPPTWSELIAFRNNTDNTGFEARTFQSGSEIVISYAGTDFSTANPLAPAVREDLALGAGWRHVA